MERVLEPAGRAMTPDVARWWMEIRSDPTLQARVDELADKNTEGLITPEELAEYDEYLQIASVIAVFQARARSLLARANGQ